MNEARIKLAEAIGLRPNKHTYHLCEQFAVSRDNWGKLMMFVPNHFPNPFKDANDDVAVLEWMRKNKTYPLTSDKFGLWVQFYYELNHGANYKIGDYVRAACKVLGIKL